jgi:hypothetical protein
MLLILGNFQFRSPLLELERRIRESPIPVPKETTNSPRARKGGKGLVVGIAGQKIVKALMVC